MKKSIELLVSKINESENGKLKGGFGSIKGGLQLLPTSNTAECSNTGTCTGTNSGTSCTNSGDCSKATNTSPNCSNTGTCYY